MDTEQVRVLAALGAVRCQGWVGRRDRVLLVLSGLAGLSYRNIAVLTVGDVVVTGGAATVPGPVGPITLAATQDARVCSPCVLARWLHLLDLAVIHSDGCVVTAMIARTAALVADTPHVCRDGHPLTALHPGPRCCPSSTGGESSGRLVNTPPRPWASTSAPVDSNAEPGTSCPWSRRPETASIPFRGRDAAPAGAAAPEPSAVTPGQTRHGGHHSVMRGRKGADGR